MAKEAFNIKTRQLPFRGKLCTWLVMTDPLTGVYLSQAIRPTATYAETVNELKESLKKVILSLKKNN